MTARIIYKIGQKLREDSLLTYIEDIYPYVYPSGKTLRKALFKCDCGSEYEARIGHVKNGNTISCGCFNDKNKITHNSSHHYLYATWRNMIARCTNASYPSFDHYGGRGITVCDEWVESPMAFFNDIGDRPSNNYSIDRIDNNGNYEPSNMRWASAMCQARNRRNNRMIEFNGIEMCITEWGNKLKINESTLRKRINLGWSIERTLTTSPKR